MKTRQIFLLIVLVITSFQLLWSQTGVINNGAKIIITSGASLKITGGSAADYTNLTSTTNGRIDLDGKIHLEGDWVNDASSGTVFVDSADMNGEVLFVGSTVQTVGGTATTIFEKLTLDNTSGLSLGGDISLTGNLGLTGGSITLGAYDLTLGTGSSVIGSPSGSKMIITSGSGALKKGFSGTGSFIFPVGENTGTPEYSPATLNFISGTFGGSAWASVNVTDMKHPNNASTTNYLSRYWTVDQSNISNFSCNVTFNYLEADVNGSEDNIYGGQWSDPNWIKLNPVSTSSDLVTGTVDHFSDFSGGEDSEFSVSMTMTDDGTITEGSEDGELITVDLKNDEFVGVLTPANWDLSGLPDGVVINSVDRNSSTQAIITLDGNRLVDFDSDITDISLTVDAAEFTLSTFDQVAGSGVTITAVDDPESISISTAAAITEGNEGGEQIDVILSGGTFAGSLDKTNWSLSDLPFGVGILSVSRTDATHAVITLEGDRDEDYDADITTIALSITEEEFDESDGSGLTSGTITFTAVVETASISTTPALDESNLDEAEITLDLTNETFADDVLSAGNFTLNNIPPGTTIESVTWVDANTATIALAFDGTDFDSDVDNFTITVDPVELNGVGEVTSNSLTITAIIEAAKVYLHHAGLTEENLDGEVIGVGLRNETFVDDTLLLGSFSLVNAPAGTSITGVNYLGADTASIQIAFDGTDFDANINNFYINIAAAELSGGSGIASYSLVITATDDAESIAIADDGLITEGQEDGEVITVTLTGGTFVDPLDPAKWTLSNLPAGVTKGAVSRTSATVATVTLSGNRTADYDSDITNLQVTVSSSEINDMSSGSLTVSTGVTFSANHEALAIGHPGLTESNLDGAVVGLKLSEETFADGSLDAGNFSLSGEPAGVTIDNVTWVAADSADLTLAFDGTDFDVNYNAFNINVDASELSGVSGLTSGDLTITAVDEPGVATISHAGLTEINLDGAIIGISLDQETFADGNLIGGNFILNNVPPGVTVADVVYSDPATASLEIAFDGTDFDSDHSLFDITIAGSELTRNTDITSNTLTITAIADAEAITMTDDGNITEGSESGEIITVTLTGGTFADPLTPANWSLDWLPDGVNAGTLTRVSHTSATIALDGNRSTDYDVDITNATLTITDDEVNEHEGSMLQASSGVTFTALVETATISDTGLVENDLDGAGIDVVLTNDVFVDDIISTINIVLNNAPTGVGVSAVTYTSATQATVILSFNGTDFDSDSANFSITILSAELAGEGNITSNSLTITAVAEPEAVSISHSGLTESNLNGAVVNMTLANVVFADAVLEVGNFTLNNAPSGVTLTGVTYNTATSASLTLAFDGTDFDVDVTNFNVTVLPAELSPAVNITSNSLTITAVVEAAGLTISDPGLTEENLDGNTLTLTLDQVEFADGTILPANVVLNNAPAGVTVSSVTWNTATTATLTLAYDGSDFDSDIMNFSLTVLSAEITGGLDVSSNLIDIEAIVEPTSLTITPAVALTEENLDGAVISMALTEVTFADAILEAGNFVLNNPPTGLSVSSVDYVNDTAATITLAYVRTDFDSDILNFSISVTVTELAGGADMTSNDLTITAVIENEQLNISHDGLTETNLDGANIWMDLDGVFFADATLDVANFTLNNAPSGLTIAGFPYESDTSAIMELDFVRGDFDADILNFSISVDASELSEGSGLTSNVLTITAVVEDEQVAISHAGLTADNLDQALIDMELTNVSFADTDLDEINFMLNGAPPGTSVDSAYAVDDSSAVIRLAYDNTPFAVVQNMSITVQSIELSGLDNLTSNALTVGLTGIDPGAGAMHLEIYAYGSRIFIRCDAPGKLKEATLYNILGQEVSNHRLEPVPLNEIAVDNVSNTYIIRVHTAEGIHTARIYVHVR